MALQVCKECTTAYAPAPKCPHCGANEWLPEGEPEAAEPAPAARVRPPVRPAAPEDGGDG